GAGAVYLTHALEPPQGAVVPIADAPESQPEPLTEHGFAHLPISSLPTPGLVGEEPMFSEIVRGPHGRSMIEFNFPERIGKIWSRKDQQHKSAVGIHRYGLDDYIHLVIDNETAVKDPALLKRFHPYDVKELEFLNNKGVIDPSLYYLPRLNQLTMLNLSDTSI